MDEIHLLLILIQREHHISYGVYRYIAYQCVARVRSHTLFAVTSSTVDVKSTFVSVCKLSRYEYAAGKKMVTAAVRKCYSVLRMHFRPPPPLAKSVAVTTVVSCRFPNDFSPPRTR